MLELYAQACEGKSLYTHVLYVHAQRLALWLGGMAQRNFIHITYSYIHVGKEYFACNLSIATVCKQWIAYEVMFWEGIIIVLFFL